MQQLHIVSFDIPLPANYGGAIDVFYKLKALATLDVEVTLHCFKYGSRIENEDLKKYCKNVYYYDRKVGLPGISINLPYIVYSRRNKLLLERLKETNAPILFEGLHSCYYLDHKDLVDKFKIVRCHNIEHEYYLSLGKKESFFKGLYFKIESKRLQKFESILTYASVILPISQHDYTYYKSNFKNLIIQKATAFHASEKLDIKAGTGDYLLYHGSLNNAENEESALFIINKIAIGLPDQFIIAGNNPSKKLIKTCAALENVKLVINPTTVQLDTLILNAHIHLMYASQKSGLKLKLLKSLYNGRHIIANNLMVTEVDLKEIINLANTKQEWINGILKLKNVSFTQEMIMERHNQLAEYSNKKQALRLLQTLT